jgi:hypothetical protein
MSGEFGKVTEWAGEHPVMLGVGIFAIGGIIIILMNSGSSSSASASAGSGMASFYAAQSAQQASNNTVALAQVQGATDTAVAQIAANQNVSIAQASDALAATQSNNSLTLGLEQETTAQMGQKQQFFLDTGEQQIEGQIAPYVMYNPNAAAIFEDFTSSGTGYIPAH